MSESIPKFTPDYDEKPKEVESFYLGARGADMQQLPEEARATIENKASFTVAMDERASELHMSLPPDGYNSIKNEQEDLGIGNIKNLYDPKTSTYRDANGDIHKLEPLDGAEQANLIVRRSRSEDDSGEIITLALNIPRAPDTSGTGRGGSINYMVRYEPFGDDDALKQAVQIGAYRQITEHLATMIAVTVAKNRGNPGDIELSNKIIANVNTGFDNAVKRDGFRTILDSSSVGGDVEYQDFKN